MATTFTRDDPPDRTKLVEALQLLAEHYASGSAGGAEVGSAKMTVASGVTSYAMAQLMRRLIVEGYVQVERVDELRERSNNLERGHGFLLDSELAGGTLEATPTPKTSKRPKTPKPPEPPADELAGLEDMFR